MTIFQVLLHNGLFPRGLQRLLLQHAKLGWRLEYEINEFNRPPERRNKKRVKSARSHSPKWAKTTTTKRSFVAAAAAIFTFFLGPGVLSGQNTHVAVVGRHLSFRSISGRLRQEASISAHSADGGRRSTVGRRRRGRRASKKSERSAT